MPTETRLPFPSWRAEYAGSPEARGGRWACLLSAPVVLRAVAIVVSGAFLGMPFPAVADSEADAVAPDAGEFVQTELHEPARKKSEAMARFALGLFQQESHGPDAALASFEQVLKLDPACAKLSLDVAREHLRSGRTDEALRVLHASAKARPGDFLPELLIGEAYLHHLSRPDLAARHARSALELAPESFAPVELLWLALNQSGQTSKAAALVASTAQRKGVVSPRFWLDFAAFHRRLPRDDSSVGAANSARMAGAIRQAANLGSGQPWALITAGDLSVLNRSPADAAEFYRSAHSIDPEAPALVEKLAACLIESGKPDEARPLLAGMLEKNPRNLAVCDQLGVLAIGRGDFEEALQFRRQALALAPASPARQLEIVELLYRLDRPRQAAIQLECAREEFPGAGIFTYLLALNRLQAADAAGAHQLFEKAILEAALGDGDFLSSDFYFEFGMAAEQVGNYQQAAHLFQKSIDLDSSKAARAYNYLGYMWIERDENLDEAEKLILRALESEPNNGAYMDSLGWLAFKRGKYADALVKLLRATELLPEPDPTVFDHIGDTYQKLGRIPEAVLFWRKALHLDPSLVSIVEKIDATTSKVVSQQ